MIEALIFDLDGTLANTEELHFRAWQQTLEAHGSGPFSFSDFSHYIGTSNEKVASDYITAGGWSIRQSELIAEKQSNYMKLIPQIKLCHGAAEILARFSGSKKLALASSSHQREVHAILESHGIKHYFSDIICGDMVSARKPDPEIYLNCCKNLDVKPENAIAFEDSGPGLASAKNAGMWGAAIANEFTRGHDFSRADAILESFDQVNEDLLQKFTTGQKKC